MNIFPPDKDIDVDAVLAGYLEEAKPCTYIKGEMRQDLRFKFQEKSGTIERAVVTEAAAESGMHYDGANSLFDSNCPSCKKCVSIRYPVADFKRSRTQQDAWNLIPGRRVSFTFGFKNQDQLNEHIGIAKTYYETRFPDHAAVLTAQQTLTAPFLLNGKLPLNVIEVRTADDQLVGGSINVETQSAMIGVLYYYDISLMHLQPGRQIIMTLLEQCRELGKDHLYVGPWNPVNSSLANKTQLRPYELYVDKQWHRFEQPVPNLKARGLTI